MFIQYTDPTKIIPASQNKTIGRKVKKSDTPREGSKGQGISFVPTTGSVIGGATKEKTTRITEAMVDLLLGINGLRHQLPDVRDGKRWEQAMGSFARTCSIFLRKTVLGGRNKRATRLLDDRVLRSIGLRFDRLRKIPRDGRRVIEVDFGLAGGLMAITRLDDHTLQPKETHRFRAGEQGVTLSIEWPLPGAADWIGVPSEKAPWPVSADQLFQKNTGSELSCDEWLSQQVVLFDRRCISLKEMIQTVVNVEGAHSGNVSRLATVEGEKASGAAKNPAPHILNAVTFCGIQYLHLIVIECALYLYEKLLETKAIERPHGDIYTVKLGVACSPEQAGSSRPDWVQFQGSIMISFSGVPQVYRFHVKALT